MIKDIKEYRSGQHWEYGKCQYFYIERKINDGKWKLLWGGMGYKEVQEYLKNPDSIEAAWKSKKITGLIILGVIITLISIAILL